MSKFERLLYCLLSSTVCTLLLWGLLPVVLYAQDDDEPVAPDAGTALHQLFLPQVSTDLSPSDSPDIANVELGTADTSILAATAQAQSPCQPGSRAGLTTWHGSGSLARFAYDFICNGSRRVYAPVSGTLKFVGNAGGSTRGMIKIADATSNVCIMLIHLDPNDFKVSSGSVTQGQLLGSYYPSSAPHVHVAANPGDCRSWSNNSEQSILFKELGYIPSQRITENGTHPGSTGARFWMITGQALSGTDIYEADNTYLAAKVIATNGAAQVHTIQKNGVTFSTGDEDWFKFTTASNTQYTIETFNLANGADTVLGLFDTNGSTLLSSNDNYGGNGASRIVWTASRAGVYFLKVRDYLNTRQGASYTIRVTAGAISNPDSYEPDDTYAQARTIAVSGSTQVHTIHRGGDEDWMRFSTSAGNRYVIETFDLRNNADTVLGLFDTDGGTLLDRSDDYGTGRASRIEWVAPRSATYFIKVRDYSSSRVNAEYSVRVTTSSVYGSDTYEPDDTYGRANSISTSGSAQIHTIHRAGDEDWMRFSATAGRRYMIETFNLQNGMDSILGLFDVDGGTLLARDDDSGTGAASRIYWVAPRSATYYIKVRDYSASRSNAGYSVHIVRETLALSGADQAAIDADDPALYQVLSVEHMTAPIVGDGLSTSDQLAWTRVTFAGADATLGLPRVFLDDAEFPVETLSGNDNGELYVVDLPSKAGSEPQILAYTTPLGKDGAFFIPVPTAEPHLQLPVTVLTRVEADGNNTLPGDARWKIAVVLPAPPISTVSALLDDQPLPVEMDTEGRLWITIPSGVKPVPLTITIMGDVRVIGDVTVSLTTETIFLPVVAR